MFTTLERTKRVVEDYNKYKAKIYGTIQRTTSKSNNFWKPLTPDFVKVNCDSSLFEDG